MGTTVTTNPRTRTPRRGKRALIGVLLVVLGVVLGFYGLSHAFVTHVGRPWDTSYGSSAGGPISGTITHEDGHVETFTVHDEQELRAFLERRDRELTEEYGLRSRALIGKVLLFGGLASVAVGMMSMLWAAFGSFGGSRTSPRQVP